MANPTEPKLNDLASVVHRNIDSLLKYRRERAEKRTWSERIAQAVTRGVGSVPFAVGQVVFMTGWAILNSGHWKFAWDPFPCPVLSLICGGEAIVLTTFVLVSQNHYGDVEKQRSDLDLQMSLLAEHEITRAIGLVDTIAAKLGVSAQNRGEIDELKKDTAPEAVLKAMEQAESKNETAGPPKRTGDSKVIPLKKN